MGNMWRLSVSGVAELNDDPDYGVAWEPIQCKGVVPGNISYHKPAVFGHEVVIFGGTHGDENTSEVWEFDSNKLTWRKMNQTGDIPKARDDHALCKVSDTTFIVFGGFVEGQRVNECYMGTKSGNTIQWQPIGQDG